MVSSAVTPPASDLLSDFFGSTSGSVVNQRPRTSSANARRMHTMAMPPPTMQCASTPPTPPKIIRTHCDADVKITESLLLLLLMLMPSLLCRNIEYSYGRYFIAESFPIEISAFHYIPAATKSSAQPNLLFLLCPRP